MPGNASFPQESAVGSDVSQESETPAVSEGSEALTTASEQLPLDFTAPAQGNSPAQGKGAAPLIIGILIGVLLLCGIAAALFFLLRRRRAGKPARTTAAPEKENGDVSESEKREVEANETEPEKTAKKGFHDNA